MGTCFPNHSEYFSRYILNTNLYFLPRNQGATLASQEERAKKADGV